MVNENDIFLISDSFTASYFLSFMFTTNPLKKTPNNLTWIHRQKSKPSRLLQIH